MSGGVPRRLRGQREGWAKLRWRLGATLQVWAPGRFRRGWIDSPHPGATIAGESFEVRGWTVFPSGPPVRVEAWLDDHELGRARLGVPRPDVRRAIDTPVAEVSGFELVVDLAALDKPPEDAELRVVAFGAEGERLALGPVPVRVVGETDSTQTGRVVLPLPPSPTPKAPDRPGRRALVFAHQLDLGGAQLYLFELLRELLRMEAVNPTVVASIDGPLRVELENLGVPVHVSSPLPEYDRAAHIGRVEELVGWARGREFDFAMINTASSYAFPGAEVARELGIPALWAIHESFKPRVLWADLDAEVLAIAEHVLDETALAVFEAEPTRRLFEPDLPQNCSLTLPYGVALDRIDAERSKFDRSEARREAGIADDEEVVLCLGQIQPRKGQVPLSQAFSSVAGRHPRARLVLVGGWEDATCRALGEYASSSPAASRIELVPLTGEVHRWLGIADILVCASDVESLPRAVLEGMAWETPVLATDIFGLADLIADGVTGWLCDCRDVEALAAALDRALATPRARREEMGRACRALIERRHGFDGYAARFSGLLDRLVADGDVVAASPNGSGSVDGVDLSEAAA